jgi:hypothetical protein
VAATGAGTGVAARRYARRGRSARRPRQRHTVPTVTTRNKLDG